MRYAEGTDALMLRDITATLKFDIEWNKSYHNNREKQKYFAMIYTSTP